MAIDILSNCHFDATRVSKLYLGVALSTGGTINFPVNYHTLSGSSDSIIKYESWDATNVVQIGQQNIQFEEVYWAGENITFTEELIIDQRGRNYVKTLTFELSGIDQTLVDQLEALGLDHEGMLCPPKTLAILIDENENELIAGYDFPFRLESITTGINGDQNSITLTYISNSHSRARNVGMSTPLPSPSPSITPSISVTPTVTPSISVTSTPSITPSAEPPKADILLIGAGGAGGDNWDPESGGAGERGSAAGGGAGGYVYITGITISATSYSIIVGTGSTGNNGTNTTFSGYTAYGGGKGGSPNPWNGSQMYGHDGGCGGGGAGSTSVTATGGTASQGYNGGDGLAIGTWPAGAGGGGLGEAGETPTVGNHAGDGGDGRIFYITGSGITYGGGGGGSRWEPTGGDPVDGVGGAGGGGDGHSNNFGGQGIDGLGGGGGAGWAGGGRGGNGVAIIRLLTANWSSISGGTQTTDGSYTVCTFTSNGTLTLS